MTASVSTAEKNLNQLCEADTDTAVVEYLKYIELKPKSPKIYRTMNNLFIPISKNVYGRSLSNFNKQ